MVKRACGDAKVLSWIHVRVNKRQDGDRERARGATMDGDGKVRSLVGR